MNKWVGIIAYLLLILKACDPHTTSQNTYIRLIMAGNMIFWVSECIAYIPIDTDNATAAINYIHLN